MTTNVDETSKIKHVAVRVLVLEIAATVHLRKQHEHDHPLVRKIECEIVQEVEHMAEYCFPHGLVLREGIDDECAKIVGDFLEQTSQSMTAVVEKRQRVRAFAMLFRGERPKDSLRISRLDFDMRGCELN